MTHRDRGLQLVLAFTLSILVAAALGCGSSGSDPSPTSPEAPSPEPPDDPAPDDPAPDDPAPDDPAPDEDGLDPDSPELEPFRAMARADADCPPSRSRLWLVDDLYVVWEVETMCDDVGSLVRMFDAATQQRLCIDWIDIAGGGTTCESGAPRDMFETIRLNLDLPDLGLGPDHTVEVIPF